jgi:hypothetical protein
VGGKLEELSFCGLSERPRNARIQKPNHGLQHAIRRERVTPVDAEGPPAQTQHHRLVRVGQDSFDITETERLQPIRKTILEEETLPRSPAVRPHGRAGPRLSHFPADPLTRFQSP